jgi:uncharacterized membrane protein YjjB (DUF3815 family)
MADLQTKAVPQLNDTATVNFVYRVVVIALAVIGVGGFAAIVIVTLAGKAVPESAVALAATAVGAMAGLLAPSPAAKQP